MINTYWKNLIKRSMTGAVYVALVVVCSLHPIPAFLLFAVMSAATMWEFCTLMNDHRGVEISRTINALSGVLLVSAVWLDRVGAANAPQMYGLYGFTLLYLIISELYRQGEDPIGNLALTLTSQLYVAMPLSLLSVLSFPTRMYYTHVFVLSLFVFIWINDTGAYLMGSALHNVFPAKLFERISPKKSWVGSIGGGVLTLAAAALVSRWFHELTMLQWMGFAFVVVVFGTWGDLVESLLKRQLGVKDSGKVLPGHGGLLDRLDSALLAIPAVVLYFIFLGQ